MIHEYLSVQFLYDSDIPPVRPLDSVHLLVQHHHAPGQLPPQLHAGHMLAAL